jgi:4,5-DOPA dioxygenase extradiol
MTERPSEAAALREHPDFRLAAPTPDHFIPLLHLAGLAAASKQNAQVLVDGYAFGSLSMTSFTLDAECPTDGGDRRPGASLPNPEDVPAEDTNV